MATYSNIDDLVNSVTLFIPRPLFFHGYVLPFVILYASWIYGWIFVYGSTEYLEAGFVGISVIALCQLFCGLFCHWSVHVQCFFSCNEVKSAEDATLVKVVPTPNNGKSELVNLHKSKRDGDSRKHIWFMFQKTKYIWDENKNTFRGIEFPLHYSFGKYMEWKGYQDDNELQSAEMIYGGNEMDMVVPEFMELFKERATAPLFVFQVFCVALWFLSKYFLYSVSILVLLVLLECTFVWQQLKNMAQIRNMGNKPYFIQVYRKRKWRSILSDQLIPGDIVSISRSQNENLVPCDMLLLRGPCMVDESMLTGESVPQMKEPIENADLNAYLNIESDGKLHVLFGGTKVVQHTPPSKVSGGLKAQDNGCVAYVLRTAFNTSQGKLLRTILFGVKRVTANNLETFAFILFLLIFAVAAAGYVWVKGCEDPNRSRYELFLECALILTSVVPPELRTELSLAVNSSLARLSKLDVFCTEPFRIPFAGKVDICCFDKTGTLTSDNLVVEGLAGLTDKMNKVTPILESPPESIQILATCHSLAQLDDGIVGDPLEKAALRAIEWSLTNNDSVIPKWGKMPGMKIFRRYHFSSALKRMSVVAGYIVPGTSETNLFAAVKGAPEVLKGMFSEVPANYDEAHLEMTRRGARVLALGWKDLDRLTQQQIREKTRDELECNLKFAGFVVISCPLRYDSKSVIKEILNSSHSVVMITGDNPLTACHVAGELKFTQKPETLLLKKGKEGWIWESISQTIQVPISPESYREIIAKYDLCITGEGLTYLMKEEEDFLKKILPHIAVFARVSPKQKEQIILSLKCQGYCTVMCGDGTNDVGALKHADVGVAIISNAPERRRERDRNRPMPTNVPQRTHERNPAWNNERLRTFLSEMEEQERSQVLKLGDASIAAPFTSKISSIQCISHVIKQGRCTLVTTLQMFKIIALNALISAYAQSVLYLDGIKYSDFQMTLQGTLLCICFFFITWSKPLKTLSRQRPLPNIFNGYIISTVLLQFLVHFFCLIFMVEQASVRSPKEESVNEMGEPKNATSRIKFSFEEDEDEVFVPNLVNSTVFILSIALQVSNLAINYRGHPFTESLWENKPLLCSILMATGVVFVMALGIFPELPEWLEIVEFTSEFRWLLVEIMIADFVFSYLVDRICLWLMGEGKLKLQR